jgi:hypothetical protein
VIREAVQSGGRTPFLEGTYYFHLHGQRVGQEDPQTEARSNESLENSRHICDYNTKVDFIEIACGISRMRVATGTGHARPHE